MKLPTYISFNFKKELSNSTTECIVSSMKISEKVNLYCFQIHGYLSFYHLKNESIILFFINIPFF